MNASPSQVVGELSWTPHHVIQVGEASFSIHTLGIVIGYVIGYMVLKRRAVAKGIWDPTLDEAVIAAIPGVLIGSRLFWAIPLWISGQDLPLSAVTTTRFTNISFLGGLAGGLAFGLGWLAFRQVSVRPVLGLIGESVGLGLAIARVGDLVVADHLGRQTGLFFGFELPEGSAANGACVLGGDVCHQTALYEFVALVPLLVVAVVVRRKGASDLRVLGMLFGGYGFLRLILVEPFRMTPRVFGLTGSQWTALAMMTAAMVIWKQSRHDKEGDVGVRAVQTSEEPAIGSQLWFGRRRWGA